MVEQHPETILSSPNKRTRRHFIIGTALGLGGILGGDYVMKQRQIHTIEKQLLSKRLFFLTPEKVKDTFGEKLLHHPTLQRHQDKLRLDMKHFSWTDQAHQFWKELHTLLDPDSMSLPVNLSDQWTSSLYGKKTFQLQGEIIKNMNTILSEAVLEQLFEDIILYIRDSIEQQQYEDILLRNYGSTAGVVSDINANLVSLQLAKQQDLITHVQYFWDTKYPQEENNVSFKNPQVIEYIFGTDIYQDQVDHEVIRHLLKPNYIKPKTIPASYQGLQVILN